MTGQVCNTRIALNFLSKLIPKSSVFYKLKLLTKGISTSPHQVNSSPHQVNSIFSSPFSFIFSPFLCSILFVLFFSPALFQSSLIFSLSFLTPLPLLSPSLSIPFIYSLFLLPLLLPSVPFVPFTSSLTLPFFFF